MQVMFDILGVVKTTTTKPDVWIPCPNCPTQCPNWPNCNETIVTREYSTLSNCTAIKLKSRCFLL